MPKSNRRSDSARRANGAVNHHPFEALVRLPRRRRRRRRKQTVAGESCISRSRSIIACRSLARRHSLASEPWDALLSCRARQLPSARSAGRSKRLPAINREHRPIIVIAARWPASSLSGGIIVEFERRVGSLSCRQLDRTISYWPTQKAALERTKPLGQYNKRASWLIGGDKAACRLLLSVRAAQTGEPPEKLLLSAAAN